MNTKEALIGARDLIDSKGLSHHAYEDGGCHCTVGAIVKQFYPEVKMGEYGFNSFSARANEPEIVDTVRALGFKEVCEVFLFNDESLKDEVVARFDEAIAKL